MKPRIAGRAGFVLACAILIFLPACDSDTPTTPPTTTLPAAPAPAPVVVLQGGGPMEAETAGFVVFTVSAVGRLDATIDWTFATNDVDIFIARGSCTEDQFLAGACQFAATATSETAKPERLSVANAAVGTYTFFIANFGPGDESVSFQVVHTPNASNLSAASQAAGQALALKRPLRGVRGLR